MKLNSHIQFGYTVMGDRSRLVIERTKDIAEHNLATFSINSPRKYYSTKKRQTPEDNYVRDKRVMLSSAAKDYL